MKSIVDTLGVIKDAVARFEEETRHQAEIALIGGYAAVYYGSERTTFDVDACFYAPDDKPGQTFFAFLKRHLPSRFQLRFLEASKDLTDPLKHDLIIIQDADEDYPRIDVLVARYTWELEGLEQAKTSEKLAFPIMPAPHIVAMKLTAGGRKDELDIIGILKGMSEEELSKAKELAKKVKRDRNFTVPCMRAKDRRGSRALPASNGARASTSTPRRPKTPRSICGT